VLDLSVANDSERGLLGIALSPSFVSDQRIYLYYTAAGNDGGSPISNSVKRYRWTGSQLIFDRKIIDLPATPGPNHDGGKIVFGPKDGYLYIGAGELNRNEQTSNHRNSSDVNRIGAILRVSRNGRSIPTNPFYSAANIGTARAPLNDIFAYGIRNTFGLAFDPQTRFLWQSENGPSFYDEINRISPGFNSGWESIMGPTSRNGGDTGPLVSFSERSHYEDPKFSWATPVAPTALHFLDTTRLGNQYKDDLFVGSVKGGKIFHFDLSPSRKVLSLTGPLSDVVADNSSSSLFAEQGAIVWGSGFGTVTDIKTAPGGMFVLSYDNGAIYRITTASPRASALGTIVPEPMCISPLALLFMALRRRGTRAARQ
jgi:glucose/arabinose dehydrogenase